MLQQANRIRKRDEFSQIYKQNTKKAGSFMVFYTKENDMDAVRFGFSISKKVGKANVRNLYKRRMREIVRLHLNEFRKVDVVVVARRAITDLDYAALEKEFLRMAKRSGILEITD